MSVNVYDPINDTLIPVAGATLYADTPIGVIQAFDAEEVPDGWLIFNGQTKNRADYPDLWARANRNGQVGVGKFYGIGDGSTTFTLADLRETSLKGYGETSRSVGAHVKSGGLAVGEFIDDRNKSHNHRITVFGSDERSFYMSGGSDSGDNLSSGAYNTADYTRLLDVTNQGGATTEVKAVGVVWAVKAKMTGLPIDLKEQVDKVEEISGTTNGIIYHVRKNNSIVCIDFEGTPTSPSTTVDQVMPSIPQNFRPRNIVRGVFVISNIDKFAGTVNVQANGEWRLYVENGTTWQNTNYAGSLTYII